MDKQQKARDLMRRSDRLRRDRSEYVRLATNCIREEIAIHKQLDAYVHDRELPPIVHIEIVHFFRRVLLHDICNTDNKQAIS